MSCLPGQVFRDLCVSCPVGTYALGNVCLMAPTGFYVSTSASTSYLPCSHAPIEGAASCNSVTNRVSTVVGGSTSAAVDGQGTLASFSRLGRIGIDTHGTIFATDSLAKTIRKISSSFDVSTIAGSKWGIKDGIGTASQFKSPMEIDCDRDGNVYVIDSEAQMIRRISSTGATTTVAGWERYTITIAGRRQYQGVNDGIGTAAEFYLPTGLTVDSQGNCYVCEAGYGLIRKIDTAGAVTTIAGMASRHFPKNFDGVGTMASFRGPSGLALDSSGNLYVAEYGNCRIRKIELSSQTVTTYAGSGPNFYNERRVAMVDGPKIAATFNGPTSIVFDSFMNMYITEMGSDLIRRISSSGYVTTVAGSGVHNHADGIGTSASFSGPLDLVLDLKGNLLVTDKGSATIRKIELWSGYRCKPGEYFTATLCAAVPAGYYNPFESSGVYFACPVGKYSASPGATLSCTNCPAGSTTTMPAQTSCTRAGDGEL